MSGSDQGEAGESEPDSTSAGDGAFADTVERSMAVWEKNLEAQNAFLESWVQTIDDAALDDAALAEGVEGYAEAYDTWMKAGERMLERLENAAAGEDVGFDEFRNIWLGSANEAFKEVMSTSAFAAATGDTVEHALAMKQQADDAANDALHEMGFATAHDLDEVAARLVELERRQQAVEDKLDRILDAVEG